MMKVAFLGLGAMGTRMAASLISAQFDLTVWNRNIDRADSLQAMGARVATQPNEAAADADVVIAMLRDDLASRDVWTNKNYGALNAMKPGAIAIESSTLSVDWVKQLAAHANAQGVSLLDAPVSGSTPSAESKQLIYLVGGEAAALARVRTVLNAMGSAIHYAGPTGSGAIVKLMINTLLGVQAAALAELIPLAERAGIDATGALEIIASTSVCSPTAKSIGKAMLTNQFAPTFPIALFTKDMHYATEFAATMGANTPISSAIYSVLKAAQEAGWGDEQYAALVKLYR
jgi:3-hydroxyisobutyrate dehydrogenase